MEKNHVEAMSRNERFNQATRRWKVFEQLTSKRLIYCRHSVFEKYADALRWKNAQHKLLLQDDFHKSRHLQSQKKNTHCLELKLIKILLSVLRQTAVLLSVSGCIHHAFLQVYVNAVIHIYVCVHVYLLQGSLNATYCTYTCINVIMWQRLSAFTADMPPF